MTSLSRAVLALVGTVSSVPIQPDLPVAVLTVSNSTVSKAEKRAKREGTVAGHGQKACDMCDRSVDLLIRCQVDHTPDWKMVCGKCWKTPEVAGGVVDGDGSNPHYRYGGLWKNLHRAGA